MANSKASQTFIPIKDIKDDVIILKEGGLRAVVIASSLNFALKSTEEQSAILVQFQDFLNSLDFPIQIAVESRRLDIKPYLALMEQQYERQESDLMKLQTREYINFIREFTNQVNIMSKSFFIVIPYIPAIVSSATSVNPFAKKSTTTQAAAFEEQRISIVEQGLSRCGIRTLPLRTEELIELFYKVFNPGETEVIIKNQQ